MSFDDTKTIITPEQVSVSYRLAGIGTRFAAMLVDTFIQAGLALLVIWAAAVFEPSSVGRLSSVGQGPSWVIALLLLALFAVIWGYFILWEAVWNGQTPGKRASGIRVIRDGGYPVDFQAAFVRNIMRYVDFVPAFYGIGALTMFLSKDSKRLGDYAAGTVVVVSSRPPKVAPPNTPTPTYRLLGDPTALNLRAITREQFGVVERFLDRRQELPDQVRQELARKIALPLLPAIGIDPPIDPQYPYDSLLSEMASAYRSRRAS